MHIYNSLKSENLCKLNKKKLKIFHFSCIFLLIYDKLEKIINKNLVKGGPLWKVDPVIPVVF